MMASKQVGYTPLELLLLFRSSLDHGVEAESFGRISETLRNNEFVKGDEHYDPMRLAPELLQKQFFRMIGHELRGGPEETNGTTDGTAGPTAGKKKQASPSPPSRTEVAANLDKVAAMLQKLYTQYREYTLRKVQEEERLYDNVQKEIGLIKKSENERLARLAAAQQNNQPPALAPREVKPAVSSPHTAPPTPTPASAAAAAVAAANAKRPSVPNTPVAPPRLPAQASAPAHSPSVTPVRPPSAQPPSGPVATPPVLQAPTGVPQQQNRALQPPQTARPSISPRPAETPHKPPASQPQAAPVQGQGQLKWEKPYQPQSAQTPPPRPYQPSPAPPKSAIQQQHAQNQQQWQQHMQAQYAQHAQHTQHAQHAQHAQHGQPGQHAQHAQHAQQTPHTQQVQQAQQAQQVQQVQQAQQAQGQMQQAPVQPSAQVPPQQIPPQQQHQQQQHQQQQHPQHGKAPVLVPPQGPGQAIQPPSPSPARAGGVASLAAHSPSPQPRPPAKALTPAPAPTPTASRPVHAIQPHQPQQGQQLPHGQHAQQQPRPIASASPTSASGPSAPPPQRRPQGQYPQQQAANVTPVGSPAPAPQDKNYASPYTKPAIPEHMIRHAAAGTPKVSKVKRTPAKLPQTPVQKASPSATLRATDTIWTPKTTKATIQPSAGLVELESPAYEPLSPPTQPAVLPMSAPAKQLGRPFPSVEEPSPKPVKSRTRSVQKGSATWAGRRAQSVASQPDELAMDQPEYSTKIKNEVLTPRANDDAGETTADESVQGRDNYTTPMGISRVPKRRRQDTPPTPSGPPSHVLWTRGFTKVSSSALDQISSHRDANMFATTVREKNAPNYRQIVLQPQDITSIRSAIKSGNKAAHQAANSLPNGDPGTATVWLPASEDLMPPKGIINSGQLESELVHMFCNAIMYNPDPQRGPGASFMKRAAEEEEEATGYLMDENGVVKNTVAMFLEVEKLLGDLRSAEKERSAPPTTTTTMTTMTAAAAAAAASNAGNAMSTPRPASMAATTPADDTAEEEDELAGDGDAASGTASRKRRMTYKT